jgi:hypothetical protein
VPYFHGVFALPARIADIAYQNKTVIYGILFETAADTRKPFIEQFVSGRTGDGCCRDCAIALFAISEFEATLYDGAQLPRGCATVPILSSPRTEAKRRRPGRQDASVLLSCIAGHRCRLNGPVCEPSSRFGAHGTGGLQVLWEDGGLVFCRGWREGRRRWA